MIDWWTEAQKFYRLYGYLVFGFASPRSIGTMVPPHINVDGRKQKLPQPFRIVAETTVNEFTWQAQLAGLDPHSALTEAYFYRAVTE